MDDIRYGFYLRPSAAMCRAQAEVHDLLARQYGLRIAGRFMPHATIKGFFGSNASPATMVAALDAALAEQAAFTVVNRGPVALGSSAIVLDVHHDEDGSTNEPLQTLHEASIAALLPLVRPDCSFTSREWLGPKFFAHLTLAMADLRPEFADEVYRFIQDLGPIGPERFLADTFHLYAFRSRSWDGEWGPSLDWDLLHSWRLPSSVAKGSQ